MFARYPLVVAIAASLLLHGMVLTSKFWLSADRNANSPTLVRVFTSRLLLSEKQSGLLSANSGVRIEAENLVQLQNSGLVKSRLNGTSATTQPHGESESESNDSTRYWENFEVDETAQPVGEWVINPEALPLASSTVIKVKLWISAAGTIEAWKALGPYTRYSEILACLEPIVDTVINPARRKGQAVASIKLIELKIERD